MFNWWMLKGVACWENSEKQPKRTFLLHIPKLELRDPNSQSYNLQSLTLLFAPKSLGHKTIGEKEVEIGVIEQKRCDLSQLI